jgi:elongator complex protein 3
MEEQLRAGRDRPLGELLEVLLDGGPMTKQQVHDAKMSFARKYRLDRIPSDADLLAAAPPGARDRLVPVLRTKAVRELSGVVTIAAMTSPEKCPHGKCLYCPGGVERNSPQSYTGKEPAAMRGSNYGYDGYAEVKGRLEQLRICGHPTDKVDLIVMGGTFPARPLEYQMRFIKGCYDALNCGPLPSEHAAGRSNGVDAENQNESGGSGNMKELEGRLKEAVDRNESAPARCIGLTIETRPDWCQEGHIDRMLTFGTTRVELGVQSLSDEALGKMMRGHGVRETMKATQLARDAGLKVGYHMMPGFPYVGVEEEISQYIRLFEDGGLKPDMLKLYPTLVMEGTGLHDLWKKGEYRPLSTDGAVELISEIKSHLPPWVRVQRIQRDIPAQLIGDGVTKSNLRQLVKRRMAEKGLRCRCIRCREVGHLGIKGRGEGELALKRCSYEAAGGTEEFISLETDGDALAAYLRLRRPSPQAHRPELSEGASAIVRELRVLGEVAPLETRTDDLWQHRGLGARLLNEAEQIARQDWGMERLLVNSGAGARGYYRRTGYLTVGPFMGKLLRG